MLRSDRTGTLHLPMAGLLLLLATAAAGVSNISRDWHALAVTQLRLDECVGKKAHELKGVLNGIESDNFHIRAIRASIAASMAAAPELLPALRLALQAKVLRQEVRLAGWNATRAAWLLRMGCGEMGDLPLPLPSLGWFRPPPDAIGTQPLQQRPGFPTAFQVEVHHPPRSAAARVTRDGAGPGGIAGVAGFEESGAWIADWKRPSRHAFRLPGTGTR